MCLLKVKDLDSPDYILLLSKIKTSDFSIYFNSEYFGWSSPYSALERKISHIKKETFYLIDFPLTFECLLETSKNSAMNLKHKGYKLTYLGQSC